MTSTFYVGHDSVCYLMIGPITDQAPPMHLPPLTLSSLAGAKAAAASHPSPA